MDDLHVEASAVDPGAELITENLDIWASAMQTKSSSGRGSNKKLDLYGIKKLRELILELAVRGRLVPQDPSDESASELLERVAVEKDRLVKSKKIKKPKKLLPISEDEKPFDLPSSWEWARFPDVSYYTPGKTPSTKNSAYWDDAGAGIPWVSIGDLNHFGAVAETNRQVSPEAASSVFKCDPSPAGTMLMSFKLTVGKISLLEMPAYHNEAILSIYPFSGVSQDYLFRILPSRAIAGNTKSAIMGNTLNSESLSALLVPVPPTFEQHRIVAKVDELMALCDQLEQQTEDSTEAHTALVETLLATLTNSKDAAELEQNWNRIAEHFDTLFTTEHSIDQLKETVLQLAVMGKLVPQDPNDEPASVLLERIAAEKDRLVKEKKIKKQKPLPPTSEDERPFPLPKGWCATRLNDLIHISSGDGLIAKNMVAGGVPVYGGNGVAGIHNKWNVTKPTLVIGRVGYYCGSIHITPEKAWVTDNAFITTFPEDCLHLNFLAWLLKATNLKENERATAQPVISGKKLYPIVVALPPKNEQHRIVAKVDELMNLCEQLKESLKHAQQTQLHLADSLVEKALKA
jgi:type I restriction enzyme S subunit